MHLAYLQMKYFNLFSFAILHFLHPVRSVPRSASSRYLDPIFFFALAPLANLYFYIQSAPGKDDYTPTESGKEAAGFRVPEKRFFAVVCNSRR